MLKRTFILLLFLFNFMACSEDTKTKDILEKSKITYSKNCKLIDSCGALAVIDCGAAVDAPLYFIETKKSQLIQCCGGCCDTTQRKGTQCSQCPPTEWTKCKQATLKKNTDS
jgi:hypothetical protein